jgi:hypothetical protein
MDRLAFFCLFLASIGSLSCGGDVIVVRTNDATETTDTGSVDSVADAAPDAQTCSQLQASAKASFAAVAAHYQSCAVDSDCTFATNDCLACCVFPIINTAYASTVGAASNALCEQLAAEGCAIPQCAADCVGIELRCIAGTCEPLDAIVDAAPETSGDVQSCASLQQSASSALAAAINANGSCATNSDCANANVGCLTNGYPIPVSVAGESSVESLASQLCAQLASQGCSPADAGTPVIGAASVYCGFGGTCEWQ